MEPARVELLNAEGGQVQIAGRIQVAGHDQDGVAPALPKEQSEFSENSYDSDDIAEATHDHVNWSDIEFANRTGASRALFAIAKSSKRRVVFRN